MQKPMQCTVWFPAPTDSRAQGTPQKRGWKEWRSQNTMRSAIRLPLLEIVAETRPEQWLRNSLGGCHKQQAFLTLIPEIGRK